MSVKTELWPHDNLTDRRVPSSDLSADKANLDISIKPKVIFSGLMYFFIFLLVGNLAAIIVQHYFDRADPFQLTRLFIFDDETNIPTFFSSLILLFSAGLLAIIAAAQKKLRSPGLPWLGLAAIFLFLSIDEAASFHEKLTVPFREFFGSSGLFFFAWVIPYGLALAILCVLYFRFLSELPRKIKLRALLSGVIYISGALGFEMISGVWAEAHGNQNLIYSLIVTCEELLEMLGIIIFIYTLLLYISERFDRLTITAVGNLGADLAVFEENFLTNYSAGFPAQSYMRSQAIGTPLRRENGLTDAAGAHLT